MAHTKSTLKRIRQSEKRRLRNRTMKSKVKTYQKKAEYAVKNAQLEDAKTFYREFASAVDKAVKKNLFHKNNAARQKSSLMKKINSITANKE